MLCVQNNKDTCFQTGFFQNGINTWNETGRCSTSVTAKKWFKVKVTVTATSAEVYVDDQHVVSAQPHYPLVGSGGVFTWRGYSNIIRFRKFEMHSDIV